MLTMHIPIVDYSRALEWTIDQVFSRFLGLEYELLYSDNKSYVVSKEGQSFSIEHVFAFSRETWLSPESLPATDVKYISSNEIPFDVKLYHGNSPILYGNREIDMSDRRHIGLDIFGSIFFLLSMYEECMIDQKDIHSRIDLEETFLCKTGLYTRPIVNEYVEILWGAISSMWPELRRKNKKPKTVVTCDIDQLYACEHTSFLWLSRRVLLNLRRRVCTSKTFTLVANYFSRTSIITDPYYNDLLWLIDENEKNHNSVLFYFIAGSTSLLMDTCYKIDDDEVTSIILEIYKRGHKIGVHPSYNTCSSHKNLDLEIKSLNLVLEQLSIEAPVKMSRQHYLKWSHPNTPHILRKSGIKMDSSIGYSKYPGFRAGTCFSFELFDPVNQIETGLIESPLILMDVALFDDAKKHPYKERFEYMDFFSNSIKNVCYYYGGNFVLLWHNNQLSGEQNKRLYSKLIKQRR